MGVVRVAEFRVSGGVAVKKDENPMFTEMTIKPFHFFLFENYCLITTGKGNEMWFSVANSRIS